MTRAASFNYKKISKVLKAMGCVFVRRAPSSHEVRYSPYSKEEFTVVDHGSKTTPKGTLTNMLKCADISKTDFYKATEKV